MNNMTISFAIAKVETDTNAVLQISAWILELSNTLLRKEDSECAKNSNYRRLMHPKAEIK